MTEIWPSRYQNQLTCARYMKIADLMQLIGEIHGVKRGSADFSISTRCLIWGEKGHFAPIASEGSHRGSSRLLLLC